MASVTDPELFSIGLAIAKIVIGGDNIDDKQRNELVDGLFSLCNEGRSSIQKYGDHQIGAKLMVLKVLKDIKARIDKELKLMSTNDHRNTLIVEANKRTKQQYSIPQLQAKGDMELVQIIKTTFKKQAMQRQETHNNIHGEPEPIPPPKSVKQVSVAAFKAFDNFGELGELLQILSSHMEFMAGQEKHVDEFINKQTSADLLRTAKEQALCIEKASMEQIMNISEMNTFLNNIILIENLFNSLYTDKQREIQKAARDKYAPNILMYEQKPKPISDVNSFVELMFAGTNLHIPTFKKLLNNLETECKKQGIKIVSNSGAKGKNIERAFYKSFYVYAVEHKDAGFKQMTDVLRCSIVFDDFNDLYKCFAIIEKLANNNNNGGILRCKDRFNPLQIPFGYRDMLINIYCPKSKIVCEIQLHHILFYKNKKISHKTYKKARLFEDHGVNSAYNYANEHIRKIVGTKIYELTEEDEKGGDDEDEEEEIDESIMDKHEFEMTYAELFDAWKLSKFIDKFVEEGFGEKDEDIVLSILLDLTADDLTGMNFGKGHIRKFQKKLDALKGKKEEFEEIKRKRKIYKKQQAQKQNQRQQQQQQEKEVIAAADGTFESGNNVDMDEEREGDDDYGNVYNPNKRCKISFLSHFNRYLCAEPWPRKLVCDRLECKKWAIFTSIPIGNGLINLVCHNGNFVTVEPNGKIMSNRQEAGEWEQFKVIQTNDGKFGFLSFHKKFFSAQPNGSLECNRENLVIWEKFKIIVH